MKRSRLFLIVSRVIIAVILLMYCVITVFPFYVLFVRSFVSTSESSTLHLWIPEFKGVDLNVTVRGLSVYSGLDTGKFAREMGIEERIEPSLTMKQVAEKYHIPEQKIVGYLKPMYVFSGWYNILKGGTIVKPLLATLFVVIMSVCLGCLLGLATGSVLAGFRKKWCEAIYNIYMLQMVIAPMMIILPLYIIITKYLHLQDSYLSIILLNIKGGAISTMIFTSYIYTLPRALEESIDIDGGNRFQYFFKILIPLSKPAIATYIVIMLPGFWNEFLYGYLFLSPKKYTLVPLIQSFIGTYTSNYQAMYAGLCVSLIPVLIFYLALQKLFVRSLLAGSIKG